MRSGLQQQNVHLASFSPQHNDPSTQFYNVVAGYESMNRHSNPIVQSLVPRCSVADVDHEYHEVLILMQNTLTDYHIFQKCTVLTQSRDEYALQSNQLNACTSPKVTGGSGIDSSSSGMYS